MGLATINGQYNGLNGMNAGLGGYMGGFGAGTGSLYTGAYVDNVKNNIANGYEISATSNSYANKASVSSSSFNQQCQSIGYLLQQGRSDAAMKKYHSLYDDMASNSYYQGYNENEIKTLIQEQYLNATGSTIVNDAVDNGKSSFVAGLDNTIPVFGLLNSSHSKEEFVAEVTGTSVSKKDKVRKAAGVATGVALSGALGAAAVAAKQAFTTGGTTMSKMTGALIAGGVALATYIGGRFIKG